MDAKIEQSKKYLSSKNINFEIVHNEYFNLPVIIINKKSSITILEENTWDEIKRNIDNKLSIANSFDCSICCLNNIKKKYLVINAQAIGAFHVTLKYLKQIKV